MKIPSFASIVLITAGVLLSGCIHQNQRAWSDQRENGGMPLVQPSLTPTPTSTPTPMLEELMELKREALDDIDDALDEIEEILQSPPRPLDETE